MRTDEAELAARVAALSAESARWVLYRVATGSDAVRADLADCLDAADRRVADDPGPEGSRLAERDAYIGTWSGQDVTRREEP